AVFRVGMDWRVIDAKWEGMRDAFDGFEPQVVAAYGPDDVERLVGDPRIIRSRPKVEATIYNAEALLELDAGPGGFRRWLRSHDDFGATVSALKHEFRFIGDTGGYSFLYVVGEPVPPHEEWFTAKSPQRARRGT